jgi:hypothetical protein
VTSRGDAPRADRTPGVPGRGDRAARPVPAAAGGIGWGFTRRTVLLIVGLLVFAAGCAAVILIR